MESQTDREQPNAESEITPNRWYEAFRPTETFQALDGEWELAKLVRKRGELWTIPGQFEQSRQIPNIIRPGFGKNLIPASEDITMEWLRRSFTLGEPLREALARGDRVLLHFGGVAWKWSAWLNGTLIVDRSLDALNSQDVDVTALLKREKANTLIIGATDSHGLCKNERYAAKPNANHRLERRAGFIAPAPEMASHPIVWAEVELWARPATRVEDIFVRPDFRNRQLRVDLEIRAVEDCEVTVAVLDSDGAVADVKFPLAKIQGAQQGADVTTLTLSASWANPRLWEPEDPHLYYAEIVLTRPGADRTFDRRRQRFGFREIWISGGNIMMNGKRLFLARDSTVTLNEHYLGSTMGRFSGDSVKEQLQSLVAETKKHNSVNTVRIHRSAWYRPGAFAAYADELGLMLVPETAYTQGNRFSVKEPEFWRNCDRYLEKWIKGARNHPSIVQWSLSNEFLWAGARQENPDSPRLLHKQEVLVKSIDPTRPIGWDGDWDLPDSEKPGVGPAEMVNLHYPNESSIHWWPTESWAFADASPENPISIRGFEGKYLWKAGTKPILVGEHSWNQKNYFEGPYALTKYFGDRAFDYELWRRSETKLPVVRWQTDAWRVARFAGINPWVHCRNHLSLMPLETVVLREAPTVLHAGRAASLEAFLLNDTLRDRTYTVRWSAGGPGGEIVSGARDFRLDGGAMERFAIEIAPPPCRDIVDTTFTVSVEREGKVVNRETYPLRFRPVDEMVWPDNTALYDPDGRAAALFADLGMKPATIASIEDIGRRAAVVLG